MTSTTAAPASQQAYSPSYRNLVLWLLVTAYTFNFIDRTILNTIGQAIKEDLRLSDTQLGWLTGLAFAALYTTLGLPIARLAERYSRVNIISIAIVIWCAFTALCGTATTYLQLLLYRIGVGVGEAGLTPPAHSLISDYFEPGKRASALSVYSFGIPLGAGFGAVAGGWIAENISWQAAFMMVGLPGLGIALGIKLFVKEPPRGWADQQIADASAKAAAASATASAAAAGEEPPGALGREASEAGAPNEGLPAGVKPPSILAVGRRLFGSWGMLNLALGITIASFAGYGTGAYAAPYFIREFGLGLALVGLATGVIAMVANGAGTLLGGFLTDWASKRSVRWYALVPAIGLILATPLYILAYTRDDYRLAWLILLVPGVLHYTYLGPTLGVVQNVMDVRMRATAVALLWFFLNLVALGFGPPFCGWCIDQFARAAFHATGLAGDFLSACPGGKAPAGSAPELAAACQAALNQGTRQGLVANLLIYAWGGVHYLLAAITLPRDLARAQTARLSSEAGTLV